MQVSDQTGDGTSVTVDSVTIAGGDGFVVVHADQDGAPGPVLGHAPIADGTTTDLPVPFDTPLTADQTVWPMLHVDAGAPGTYEFPGPDGPVTVDGDVVVEPLDYAIASANTTSEDELATTGRDLVLLGAVALLAVAAGVGLLRRRRHARM